MDAAKIQEEDAAFANRKGFSKHHPALPLYTSEDAERAISLIEPLDYGDWIEPAAGVRASFRNAGHILGAAMIELRLRTAGGERTIVFSGDVGRYGVPLHSDPDLAKSVGFPKPILHGLCTYGFTGRALLAALCGNDPGRFRSMDGRFSKPVFPGESLTVKMWVDGGSALFQTVNPAGDVVLDQGRFGFTS
jgi:hypothetical protein